MFSSSFGAAPASSGFGFGSKPATTAPALGSTGFSFGSAAAPSNPAPAFGAPAAAAPAAPTLSIPSFGSAPASAGQSGGFGSIAPAGFNLSVNTFAPQSTTSSTLPTSGFGQPTPGQFSFAPQQATANQAAQPLVSARNQPIAQALQRIQSAYAPFQDQNGRYVSMKDANNMCRKNEECRFKAIYMQKRDEVNPANLAQPSLLLSNPLYEEAEKLNVDPEKYIPLEESGVEALDKRCMEQAMELDQAAVHAEKLSSILKASQQANGQLMRRYEMLAMKQLSLVQQVLLVVRKLEVMRCHGVPLQVSELNFRDQLRSLVARLQEPFKQLQDLSVSMALQDRQQDVFEDSVADEDVEALVRALKKQSEGLEQLAETLRKDMRDMAIIRSRLLPAK